MRYHFPETIYDQAQSLLATLGSWWADDYAGRDQVLALVQGKAQVESQTMLDLMELIASLSRFTVPIYHTDNWYPLYLRASQRNSADVMITLYDEGRIYDDGVLYDVPKTAAHHAFPKPADLVEAPLILNRFTDPTLSQTENVDYVLTEKTITFLKNPFDDPRIAKRAIYQDGAHVDTEAILWVFRGKFDWDTVYKQFAYVVGMRLKSSEGYRNLTNAVYDAMVGGTTKTAILQAFSSITGVPVVREARETVVDIVESADNLLIITDIHVYKFHPSAVPVVAIGQQLSRGQALTDAVRVYELNTGHTPEDLHALALGRGFLATCYYADLVFENKDVSLVVDTADPSGYTKVSWELGGFPLDVQQFFDDMHARGVAEADRPTEPCAAAPGKRRGTLAHLLDSRDVRVGEPTATNLPKTINPLRFLISNVLRNNACIIRIKAVAIGSGTGWQSMRLLQKIVPPHTAMIVTVDLTAPADSVTVDGISEYISTFSGASPLREVVDSVSDSQITARVVSGTYH